MEKVNGKFMRLAFQKATEVLAAHVDELNALNVFPVPDGDTGSNMLATMKEGCKYLDELKKNDLPSAMEAIRNGTLMGARGNSGVILSQIFRGFADYCSKKKTLSPADFIGMFRSARSVAYKAVMKPVEGTILTVLRRIDEKSNEAEGFETVVDVLRWVVEVADATVKETPKLLPVLREAGVVDAGARGLYYILQGFLAVALGETEINLQVVTTKSGEIAVEITSEELTYQYCTEVMIKAQSENHAAKVDNLREFLESIGDSAVVVFDQPVIKTHVHTNDPGLVIQEALKYGELLKVKIDNMKLQHEHFVEVSAQDQPPRAYGFVAVSPGIGISEVLKNLGVDQIVRGGQTMNPSTADLKYAIDRVKAKIVFLFPNNPNIILAARQATEHIDDKKVIVIPTQTVQECISAMMSFDPNEEPEKLEEKFKEAAQYIIPLSVTRAVRDAKHNGTRIKKDEYMIMKGKKLLSHGQSLKQALSRALTALDLRGREVVTIFTGQDATDQETSIIKDYFAKAIENAQIDIREGGQPHYPYLIMIE